MSPASRSFLARHALTVLVALGSAGLLAVACSDRPDPAGPADRLPGVALSHTATKDFGHGNGSISVEVRDGGRRYGHVLVTAVHGENGPFAEPWNLATLMKLETDDNGVAVFQGLPEGNYCVHIGSVSLEAVNAAGASDPPFVVPFVPTDGIGSNDPDIGPAMIRKQGGSVRTIPLTAESYMEHCVGTDASTAPIVLTSQRPSASVRITPLQSARLETKFLGLDGNPATSVAGWAAVTFAPEDIEDIEWFDIDRLGLREGTFPGILLAVSKQVGDDVTAFDGLPRGLKVALEVLSGSHAGGGQGLLIKSLSDIEAEDELDVQMEPLLCVMDDSKFANPGTATGNGLEIAGAVVDGFRADDSFGATRAIALWYEVVGSGADELRMRFHSKLSQPTRTLRAGYSCSAESCARGAVSGTSGATATLFSRPAASGRLQVIWLIDGVPFGDDLAAAEYQLGDFPEPSKQNESRSYSLIDMTELPAIGRECSVEAGNDPPIWAPS